MKAKQFQERVGFGDAMVDGGEEKQPEVKDNPSPGKAEKGIGKFRVQPVAAERRDDDSQVKLRRPVNRGTDLPIEERAQDQQETQTNQPLPALQARGLGRAQGPDQGGGNGAGEGI